MFSSSIAVFGPDLGEAMPALVGDRTLPTPQTSYGAQKHICEHLIADYTRKGYIDLLPDSYLYIAIAKGGPDHAEAIAAFKEKPLDSVHL